MLVYLSVALFAALVTATVSWLVLRLAARNRWYQPIRERDMHSSPTPRLGGIAMFTAFLASLLLAWQIPYFASVFKHGEVVLGLVLSGSLISIIGLLDDLLDLHWTIKLAGQFAAATIATVMGIGIFANNMHDYLVPVSVISIFLIVTTMNAINFIDGLDGLVSGVCLIGNLSFFIYIYFFTREISPNNYFNLAGLLAAILVGICLGFIPFNWRPARLFMGDSGALLIGLIMAMGAITAVAQAASADFARNAQYIPAFIPLVLPFAIMSLPLLDLLFAVIRRLRAGKSPFSADKAHLHHRILDMGHSSESAVMVFYCWTAVISAGMLLFLFTSALVGSLFFALGVLLCLIITFAPLVRKKGQRQDPPGVQTGGSENGQAEGEE